MPSPYSAPLEDMLFSLKELGQLKDVLALPPYRDMSEDLLQAVLKEAATFAAEVLSPLNASGDREGSVKTADGVRTPQGFREAYQRFVANGWNAAPVATDTGGQGLPCAASVLVSEIWHGANMAFTLCPMLTQSAIEVLAHHDNTALRDRFLPKLVSGEWTGTMCMTEPQAGSDVGAVRCRAIPDGGDELGERYQLSGTKIFITYGEHDLTDNIIHMVLARLPDSPPGTKGLSLFLVPKFLVNKDGSLGARNDVHCVSIEHKMGINASPTAVMTFGEKQGAVAYLVSKPNQGIQSMFIMMNAARLAVGLEGIGVAGYASQLAHEYADEREQGFVNGNPAKLAEHAEVQRMLYTMRSHSEAMRGLACHAASLMDYARHHPDATARAAAQGELDLLIPIIKAQGSDLGFQMASIAVQVYGGLGYIEETGVAQLMRDARIAMIYEGTNGIQALDLVNRKIHLQDGTIGEAFLNRVLATITTLEALPDSHFHFTASALRRVCQQAQDALEWLQSLYANDKTPVLAHMAASSFLTMLGLLAEAWVLARSGIAVHQSREYSESFRSQKLCTMTFFMQYVLPEAEGLALRMRNIRSIAQVSD